MCVRVNKQKCNLNLLIKIIFTLVQACPYRFRVILLNNIKKSCSCGENFTQRYRMTKYKKTTGRTFSHG